MTVQAQIDALTTSINALVAKVNVRVDTLDGYVTTVGGSATDAQAALDAFEDVWLGASATAPTATANGTALAAGMLWFDTSAEELNVYSGSEWVAFSVTNTIRTGTGAPASSLGADGDFYIDTDADEIYGPKASGAWGTGTSIVGPQGATGPAGQGERGWSPQFAIVSDGARRVLQVSDWVGGEGTKPATGDYVGATGLVSLVADAIDIRGPTGASGSGTGDMVAATYDPQGVTADVFDRANHTGTQTLATISDAGTAAAEDVAAFAAASHTHAPADLTQAGATDGQVLAWDDTAGEWQPASAAAGAALTKATATHTSGTITLDLSAGRWFEFEADAYTPAAVGVQGNGTKTSNALLQSDLTSPTTDDLLVVILGGFAASFTAPAGWTVRSNEAGLGNTRIAVLTKMWESGDGDYTFSDFSSTRLQWAQLRGGGLDVYSGATTHGSTPDVTLSGAGKVLAGTLALNDGPIGGTLAAPAGYTDLGASEASIGALYFSSGMAISGALTAGGVTVPDFADPSAQEAVEVGFSLGVLDGTGSGEKDYTVQITGKPTGEMASAYLLAEVKTDAGSWTWSGIDRWVGGSAPALDSVGVHAIRIYASDTDTVGEYMGVVS
jgi:hypothetical protein